MFWCVTVAAAVVGGGCWPENQGEEGTLRLSGHVEVRQVSLSFAVSEHIAELYVDEGDRVKKGDILGRLQSEPYEHALSQAEAALEQQKQILLALETGSRPEEIRKAEADAAAAEAEFADAKRRYQRIVRLFETQAASQEDLDNALAAMSVAQARYNAAIAALDLIKAGPRVEDIEAARAELRRREAAVKLARYNLSQTELKAPADGVIEERLLEEGDWATPQRPVFILALQDPVWVRAFLPEPWLGRVHPGTRVKIRTDAAPGRLLEGRIGHISPTAEFTPRPVETPELRTQLVYEMRVWVPNPEGVLRLGAPVDVLIEQGATGSAANDNAP